ncbi:hypothetical protein QQX98_007161 [Neonectria punicea]|uniref:Sugar phosphate transporter domain-containing protein n=1 Tax=Neonectria punicea TaxID=979145 RepID=A0ABR1GYT4_9HYPO
MAARRSSADVDRKLESGTAPAPAKQGGSLHPAFYIALWIFLSSSVILFNKWVLASAKFGEIPSHGPRRPSEDQKPLFLTTWHMIFATAMTQIMARFTTTLDSRHKVPMNPTVYM